ncbi:TBC1 domain family member 22B isoform X4 [Palaemon carinicauda]|uniref:TBC1 domain family member 22B isoform X4 n=1 Tax=Palaemon carinicauda TaxID=392227 RepID=UPI0035B5A812
MQSVDPHNGKNFWKKNSKSVPGSMRAVYGAMHPPITRSPSVNLLGDVVQWQYRNQERSSPRKDGGPKKQETSDSFQDYQESVNDAWDCGDDEFCVISDVKISNRMVQSAALSVINSHRSGQLGTNTSIAELHSQIPPALVSADTTETVSTSPSTVNNTHSSTAVISCSERDVAKQEKFLELIASSNINLPELRELSWSGIPPSVRAISWRLLNGHLPANVERREETLKRKREEYWSFVKQYYETRHEDIHQDTFRQIHIDIPRMSPLVPLFQQTVVQEMFERILYIWAIRHPASGYVQGINDLVTPFFVVFLYEVVPKDENLDTYDIELVDEEDRAIVEADSFWCMSKLLDGIQDNYTFAQPGIQTKVQQLRELMKRIDINLHRHLEKHEIDYLQFSFRWFNNLLMRELPLGCTVRLWDTLHSEPNGFSHFVLYVAAAFLKHFSQQLMAQRDFQGLMLLLQNLPTSYWSDSEISLLVAEAFRLKYVFADAPNHLQANKK